MHHFIPRDVTAIYPWVKIVDKSIQLFLIYFVYKYTNILINMHLYIIYVYMCVYLYVYIYF